VIVEGVPAGATGFDAIGLGMVWTSSTGVPVPTVFQPDPRVLTRSVIFGI
jgi:hypothetical protein